MRRGLGVLADGWKNAGGEKKTNFKIRRGVNCEARKRDILVRGQGGRERGLE